MVDSGSHLYGDLCAIIAARTSATSIYNLLPGKAGVSQVILMALLCTLRDYNFEWPSEDVVQPGNFPSS
jgi:hypothetical protein